MADQTDTTQFPCRQCGATMEFDPEAGSIECPYCGHAHKIPRSEEDIEELDFHAHLDRLAASEPAHENATVRCSGCGAETTLAAVIVLVLAIVLAVRSQGV